MGAVSGGMGRRRGTVHLRIMRDLSAKALLPPHAEITTRYEEEGGCVLRFGLHTLVGLSPNRTMPSSGGVHVEEALLCSTTHEPASSYRIVS